MSRQRTFRHLSRRSSASVRLWALGVSVTAHLAVLTALGAFHFSRQADSAAAKPADISVQAIERVLEQPAPVPKPKIETPPAPTVAAVQPPPSTVPDIPEQPVAEAAIPEAAPQKPTAPSLFFGSENVAGRICYVVDGSGSMFGLMYLVRQQLRDSILNLSPEQSFNVVFFMQDGRLLQAFDGRLEAASPAAKAEALNLIGRIRPEGQTSAEQAIEAALRMRDKTKQRPEVIYFLTDGFDLMDGGGDDLIGRIGKLRKTLAPNTIVHTIGIYPARQDSDILSEMAKTCGGRYIEVK